MSLHRNLGIGGKVMNGIRIQPSDFKNFGDADRSTFCLVTTPEYRDVFTFAEDSKYVDSRVLTIESGDDFAQLLEASIPESAHILVILPSIYFKSPSREVLGNKRKLGVLACYSTPTSVDAIAHFIRIAARTDPALQDRMSEEFFEKGEAAERIRFIDPEYGTEAEFEHLEDNLSWHEQTGFLGWGQQQLFPSGEISVLPVSVFGQNINNQFQLSGKLAFKGRPVLHSGTPSFLPEDQERIYQDLATMESHAVIATLKDGVIMDLEATDPVCEPAKRMLQFMCRVDSRYSSLLEIGFGINTKLELFPGNSAMNEVYGHECGAVHWGLGLIPYTQYHLDIICPGTVVEAKNGKHIIGGAGVRV